MKFQTNSKPFTIKWPATAAVLALKYKLTSISHMLGVMVPGPLTQCFQFLLVLFIFYMSMFPVLPCQLSRLVLPPMSY